MVVALFDYLEHPPFTKYYATKLVSLCLNIYWLELTNYYLKGLSLYPVKDTVRTLQQQRLNLAADELMK